MLDTSGPPAVLIKGHRRLPKADVGDVVRRRQGRIQAGRFVGFGRISLPLTLRNTETLQKKFNDVLGRLNTDIVDSIIEQNLSD